jgi:hypothetical protein
MISSLFWDVTWRRLVVWGCPESSVRCVQSGIPEVDARIYEAEAILPSQP